MNRIESMMRILFDGEIPRMKYSNKLLSKNDMINRDKLYTMLAKDIISGFEFYGLVLKAKDYEKMDSKTEHVLTTQERHYIRI